MTAAEAQALWQWGGAGERVVSREEAAIVQALDAYAVGLGVTLRSDNVRGLTTLLASGLDRLQDAQTASAARV